MHRGDRTKIIGALLCAGAACAVAWATPAYGTPGYNYGRLHCSPTEDMHNASECRECCAKNVNLGNLAQEELDNCNSFCVVPCYPCWFPD